MRFRPPKINPIIAGPMSFFGLIGLVALHFRFLLGAQVTPEWIVAGIVVAFAFCFLILMLHEATDALSTLSPREGSRLLASSRPPRPDRPIGDISTDALGAERLDLVSLDQQRSILGLGPRRSACNRPR